MDSLNSLRFTTSTPPPTGSAAILLLALPPPPPPPPPLVSARSLSPIEKFKGLEASLSLLLYPQRRMVLRQRECQR